MQGLLVKVPLENIIPNPWQPPSRMNPSGPEFIELIESILNNGMHYLPKAREVKDQLPINGLPVYQIGDGWQRYCAYKWIFNNGHDEYKTIALEVGDYSDEQMQDMIPDLNNLHRHMNAVETAEYLQLCLKTPGMTQEILAQKRGYKNQSEISNKIRLLELQEPIRTKIISQEISETHGRYLLRLNHDPKGQLGMMESCIEQGWSKDKLNDQIDSYIWSQSEALEKDPYAKVAPIFDMEACNGCPSAKTINAGGLKDHKERACINPVCWKEKQAAARAAINLTTERQAELVPEPGNVGTPTVENKEQPTMVTESGQSVTGTGQNLTTPPSFINEPIPNINRQSPEEIFKTAEAKARAFENEIDTVFSGLNFKPNEHIDLIVECLVRGLWHDWNKDVLNYPSVKTLVGVKPNENVTIKQVIKALDQADNTDLLKILPRLAFDILHFNNPLDESLIRMMFNKFRRESQSVVIEPKSRFYNDLPICVRVTSKLFRSIKDCYSAASIPQLGGTFNYQNELYTCTGISYGGKPNNDNWAYCYHLIDKSKFDGEIHTDLYESGHPGNIWGLYHGILTKYQGQEYVMVGPEVSFYEDKKALTYRIQNKPLNKWWDGIAHSVHEACQKAGWNIEDCWVRVETENGGWAKPQEPEEPKCFSDIPKGVRLVEDVPQSECNNCKFTTHDHTVNMSFPIGPNTYQKVCLKDYNKLSSNNIIEVNQEVLTRFLDHNSCEIVSKGKIKFPIYYANNRYCCIGGVVKGDINKEAHCYLLTPKDEYKGEIRTRNQNKGKFTYEGELVSYGKNEYVITGTEITFKDPDADKLWLEKYPELVKPEPALRIPSVEEDHLENMLEQKRCAKCQGQYDIEHRCAIHRWDCPKKPLADISQIETRIGVKNGEPHVFSYPGVKKIQSENLKDGTIEICRKIGVEFEGPQSLIHVLKSYPDSINRDLLISFLEPVKV